MAAGGLHRREHRTSLDASSWARRPGASIELHEHRRELVEGHGGRELVERIAGDGGKVGVERHGGRAWIEAEPDRGARVFLALPERKEAA